ncbi:uncharacterized protein LOC124274402 [Haliotis rubra]|uniref:uncharacterized protein LOC124274402 n=1 Tax=Haliotis rubra TaxID=36100 RepID=UPI001EE5C517|nr:uncharacterized protein LOC124274402 [Haliotis rubra]
MGWASERCHWISVMFVSLVVSQASSPTYNLTSTPATAYNITSTPVITYFLTSTPATEGQPCILSCTHGLGRTISTALWYRNWVRIFQTNWRYQFEMLDKDVDHEEFRSVSGRISVDATLNRHNVILTINSTVDEESVWTCGVGVDTSNNLTVTVPEPTTDAGTTDTDNRPAPDEMTEDNGGYCDIQIFRTIHVRQPCGQASI